MKLSRTTTSLILFALVTSSILIYLSSVNYKSTVVMGGKKFSVDVADTYLTLHQGLSGRKSLASNEGMFFVFDKPDTYGFWMKDMNFPIDIIWMDKDYKIIHIEKEVKPTTYPTVFYPTSGASYVFEVGAGETDSLHVAVGDRVVFSE